MSSGGNVKNTTGEEEDDFAVNALAGQAKKAILRGALHTTTAEHEQLMSEEPASHLSVEDLTLTMAAPSQLPLQAVATLNIINSYLRDHHGTSCVFTEDNHIGTITNEANQPVFTTTIEPAPATPKTAGGMAHKKIDHQSTPETKVSIIVNPKNLDSDAEQVLANAIIESKLTFNIKTNGKNPAAILKFIASCDSKMIHSLTFDPDQCPKLDQKAKDAIAAALSKKQASIPKHTL